MIQRVALITPRLEQRGTSRYALNLARELAAAGVQVRVYGESGSLEDAFRHEGLDLRVWPGVEQPLWAPVQVRRLRAELLEFAPQIIHLNSRVVIPLGRRLARLPGKLVITVHTPKRRRLLAVSRLKRVDAVIATSEAVREDLVNVGRIGKELITVIPTGVDVGRIAVDALQPLFSRPARMVGVIGPTEKNRGQEYFIKAIPAVVRGNASAHFVVAGCGDCLPALRTLAGSLGLDRHLTFIPDFARSEDVIGAMDVVVYTSLEDVSAYSLLEAMACGRPVVAFSTPIVCSIVEHGRTGLIVTKRNVAGLAEAVLRLLGDETAARELAENARAVIRERFSTSVIARQTLRVYDAVCAQEG